ncbi:DUF2807 domain-containing protein [Hymenobacter sp. BT18]|uniref:GIN domain-containing protein n=1 Tax=Hymenobacter sp. BT18 TaxID=2835648 RepID=UPI00143ECE54|nr:DUF2807 domain-containing protein [Hymenobacter sp. BT18]QIX63009.1 DUF2807 domain-containing protein [Hymenobacter sp. BT18]
MAFDVHLGPQDRALQLLWRWWLLLVAAGTLTTCGPDHELDCLKSTGPVETTHRELPAFHTFTVYDNVDVIIVPDSRFFAEVRTGRNLQEDLELRVQDSALVIENTSRCNWVRRYDVPREVRLHLPSVVNIYQRGENSIRTASSLRTDALFCHLIGAGDVDLEVDCRYLALSQYELGDIRLRGRTDELHFTLGGLGRLFAQELTTTDCYFQTNHDSGGDAHVRASRLIGGRHAGAGTLFYAGQPAAVDISVTGKGKAIPE